jgi:hypothetical protein
MSKSIRDTQTLDNRHIHIHPYAAPRSLLSLTIEYLPLGTFGTFGTSTSNIPK